MYHLLRRLTVETALQLQQFIWYENDLISLLELFDSSFNHSIIATFISQIYKFNTSKISPIKSNL